MIARCKSRRQSDQRHKGSKKRGETGNPWAGLAVSIVLAWLGGANYGSVFSLAGNSVSPAFMATASGVVALIANLTNALLTLFLGVVREYTGSFSMALCATGIIALLVYRWLSYDVKSRNRRQHPLSTPCFLTSGFPLSSASPPVTCS
ncbi:hypothetical protein NB640_00275 [Oxalobacter vibrioformis]|uniref:Uncharacterized protein n=1 Tax=Oxalobacter vibrioformis TaxID=933080 RepID=A0A9E9LVU8_9BURK|nr:hypothetical protein [Oxalobacter vibrioformis]WAW10146.1 hypothetical protein NB640_00275 [Oxalobacter vibrioformis]